DRTIESLRTNQSTDPEPDPAMYEVSIAAALEAGEPFVVTFATPAFCGSATCGPTLEIVKAVAAGEPDMRFIHVEPYLLEMVDDSLQPVLSEAGELQPAPWMDAWNLRTEPFVAVVDAIGNVVAKFEGTVAPDELETAISRAREGFAGSGV
ncbi:MAG: TlpA family protein disulfide reductase, partial [Chloroflexota bacterium]